jgi:hypothetical protein
VRNKKENTPKVPLARDLLTDIINNETGGVAMTDPEVAFQ